MFYCWPSIEQGTTEKTKNKSPVRRYEVIDQPQSVPKEHLRDPNEKKSSNLAFCIASESISKCPTQDNGSSTRSLQPYGRGMLLSSFHLTKLIETQIADQVGYGSMYGSKCLNFRYFFQFLPNTNFPGKKMRLVLHGQFAFGRWSRKEVRNGLQKTSSFRCHANEAQRSQVERTFWGEFWKGCQLPK